MERRTALITGASQGLGRALARRLALGGWSMVIDARRADRLEEAAAELRTLAGRDAEVVAVAGDVAEPAHRAELAAAARRLGNLRLVVNNASTLGGSPPPALAALEAACLERVLRVNVVAPAALLQAVRGLLGPGAVVVNVSSDAAVGAYEGWGGYGASKAALDQLSRVLAVEHPDWRVYAFDPGDMRTEMHHDAFPGEDISDRPDPASAAAALLDLIAAERPSGRYAAAEVSS